MSIQSIKALTQTTQVALTTVASDDREYCDRLQTSLVRGNHELLYWGAGPTLFRGDIVALYTPKSKYLPNSEHSLIRRLYFVAANSTPGTYWNQHVFLHRRIDLNPPLTYQDLTEKIGLPFRYITSAGKQNKPLSLEMSARLLDAACKRYSGTWAAFQSLAIDAKSPPKVCISYSGHDWTQAHRLKLWFDAAGLAPFFVSPVGDVLSIEQGPLRKLLEHTFSGATLVLCLVPPRAGLSQWVEVEIDAAVDHAKRVIFVRKDADRPWPITSKRSNVGHYTLRPTSERELVAHTKKELRSLTA